MAIAELGWCMAVQGCVTEADTEGAGSGQFFSLIRITAVHFLIVEFYINSDVLFLMCVSQFKKIIFNMSRKCKKLSFKIGNND